MPDMPAPKFLQKDEKFEVMREKQLVTNSYEIIVSNVSKFLAIFEAISWFLTILSSLQGPKSSP